MHMYFLTLFFFPPRPFYKPCTGNKTEAEKFVQNTLFILGFLHSCLLRDLVTHTASWNIAVPCLGSALFTKAV